MNLQNFQKLPIMGIVRGVEEKHLEQLLETVIFSGLKTLEITMNTPCASELIASMVKVFPSSLFGPKYFKELKAPLDKIKLMAVGGVRPDNVKEYFDAGADAVAFGGSVFRQDLLREGKFDEIGKMVFSLVEEVKKQKI